MTSSRWLAIVIVLATVANDRLAQGGITHYDRRSGVSVSGSTGGQSVTKQVEYDGFGVFEESIVELPAGGPSTVSVAAYQQSVLTPDFSGTLSLKATASAAFDTARTTSEVRYWDAAASAESCFSLDLFLDAPARLTLSGQVSAEGAAFYGYSAIYLNSWDIYIYAKRLERGSAMFEVQRLLEAGYFSMSCYSFVQLSELSGQDCWGVANMTASYSIESIDASPIPLPAGESTGPVPVPLPAAVWSAGLMLCALVIGGRRLQASFRIRAEISC